MTHGNNYNEQPLCRYSSKTQTHMQYICIHLHISICLHICVYIYKYM